MSSFNRYLELAFSVLLIAHVVYRVVCARRVACNASVVSPDNAKYML